MPGMKSFAEAREETGNEAGRTRDWRRRAPRRAGTGFCLALAGWGFLVTGSLPAIERPPPRPDSPVALIGDSLTNHGEWAELLHRPEITNWGKPGFTTGQLAWTFKDLVKAQPGLRVVFLQGGINDLSLGIPADRIYRNVTEAIAYWREHGVQPIVQSILFKADDAETNGAIALLDERLRAFCVAHDVDYLDANPALAPQGRLRAELTTDGTHLKPEGYVLWAELVDAELVKLKL